MEIRQATMVDLVRIAYGFDNDKVLGGPNWLELDRFDIAAKLPEGSTAESRKLMLQSLLEDRFKLVVRKDTKPLTTYAITNPKQHKMKEAEGTEEPTCKIQSTAPAPSPSPDGPTRTAVLFMSSSNGQTTTIQMGPGNTLMYACRNVSMEAFVGNLKTMIGTNIGTTPITDQTGLKGHYNFDFRYSLGLIGLMGQDAGDRISIADAIDKQLGLKLEERPLPTPVIVVEKVNRTPSPDPPGLAEALPPPLYAKEFEVATIKPMERTAGPMIFGSRMMPGGRYQASGPLSTLIRQAFSPSQDQIIGLPNTADMYEINARVAAESADAMTGADSETLAVPLRALLVDRFKLKYHTEERQSDTLRLVAVKPKLKKADPESRTFCKAQNAPPGAAAGSRMLVCQNATLDMFAERLRGLSPDVQLPVFNATGLEGNYDISLTFTLTSMRVAAPAGGAGIAGPAPAGAAPATPEASDPSGGITVLDAIEKQLGLKLEPAKKVLPVIVIDHMEQKPTEN